MAVYVLVSFFSFSFFFFFLFFFSPPPPLRWAGWGANKIHLLSRNLGRGREWEVIMLFLYCLFHTFKNGITKKKKKKIRVIAGWDGFWAGFQSLGECPLSDLYPLTEPDLINPYII